jgi:hypothetical protein
MENGGSITVEANITPASLTRQFGNAIPHSARHLPVCRGSALLLWRVAGRGLIRSQMQAALDPKQSHAYSSFMQ